MSEKVVENVVDVYAHIDGMDMPMEVITFYDSETKEFRIIECVEGTVKTVEAGEEIKRLFEEKVKEVEEQNRRLAEKFDRVVNGRVCVLCGGRIRSIRRESLRRYLRLNRNRDGYYCPSCKTIWVHNRYPSPCHFSESLEAIRRNRVIYSISFGSYRSPLIPRLHEWKPEDA